MEVKLKAFRNECLVRRLRDIILEAGGTAWWGAACAIFGDGRRVDLVTKLIRADKMFALDPTIVDGSTTAYLSAPNAFAE